MLGKNKFRRTTGKYESDTSLNQSYKYRSTKVSMKTTDIYQVRVETEDSNFSAGLLKVYLLLSADAPSQADAAPVGDNELFQVLVWYPVGNDFYRLDSADSGRVTYDFNSKEQTFSATISFEVKGNSSEPGYSFTNGAVEVTGIDSDY